MGEAERCACSGKEIWAARLPLQACTGAENADGVAANLAAGINTDKARTYGK